MCFWHRFLECFFIDSGRHLGSIFGVFWVIIGLVLWLLAPSVPSMLSGKARKRRMSASSELCCWGFLLGRLCTGGVFDRFVLLVWCLFAHSAASMLSGNAWKRTRPNSDNLLLAALLPTMTPGNAFKSAFKNHALTPGSAFQAPLKIMLLEHYLVAC